MQMPIGQGECSPSEGLRQLGNVDGGRVRRLFWYVWKHEHWYLPRIPGLVEYEVRGDLADPANWSRQVAEYTPGTRLDFRRGRQNSSPYLGMGWGLRRPAHQEMVDAQATLRMRGSFEPARRYEMLLEAQLYDASPAAPARIELLVNGVTVGALVAERTDETPREYRLRIPGTALAGPKTTIITFSAPRAVPGREPMAVQTFELRSLPRSATDSPHGGRPMPDERRSNPEPSALPACQGACGLANAGGSEVACHQAGLTVG